jgi:hypothetical protein
VVYVPAAGLNVGAAATPVPDDIVHPIISWIAVSPPVPPVNPTYAVFPPTVAGILIGHVCVNVAFVVVSVIVIVKFVPSYVICTFITSVVCRFTPELVISTAGVVGDAPFV